MEKRLLAGLTTLALTMFARFIFTSPPTFEAQGTGAYNRQDQSCGEPACEKTLCSNGGNQLCTPQYCQGCGGS
jgi:hypothetical protein